LKNKNKNKNKINPVDNLICIINGIFHGVGCVQQGRKHRYHDRKSGACMVLERVG